MSESVEPRLGALEEKVAQQGGQIVAQGSKIAHIEQTTNETAADVKKLLQAQPVTWRTVGATLLTVGGALSVTAAFVWWFISISPAVKGLEDRLTELDHPRRGRVIENADRIKGLERRWTTTVVRAR